MIFILKFMYQFEIITLFPKVFKNYFQTSIIKRAQQKGLVKINIYNLRDWTTDKHKTVDDKPYGGGPGMIIKADIIYKALLTFKKSKLQNPNFKQISKFKTQNSKTILLSPAGKQFNQKLAYRYSKLNRLILICGHYEGVDARVEKFVDEKISVGPYVLTGGELPAMIVVDAVTRLMPGVIKKESLQEESFLFEKYFSNQNKFKNQNSEFRIFTEYPQFTRPVALTIKNKSGKLKTLKVPKVLLSGNHKKIQEWRFRKMRRYTDFQSGPTQENLKK